MGESTSDLAARMSVVNLFSLASVLLFCHGSVLAQIVSPGKCPVHQTQTPFNPGQFISKSWFQIRRYPSPFEEGIECSILDILSSRLHIHFNFRGINSTDRSLTTVPGKAFFDYGHLSKLILEMPFKVGIVVRPIFIYGSF